MVSKKRKRGSFPSFFLERSIACRQYLRNKSRGVNNTTGSMFATGLSFDEEPTCVILLHSAWFPLFISEHTLLEKSIILINVSRRNNDISHVRDSTDCEKTLQNVKS